MGRASMTCRLLQWIPIWRSPLAPRSTRLLPTLACRALQWGGCEVRATIPVGVQQEGHQRGPEGGELMGLAFGWKLNDTRESIWRGDPALSNVPEHAIERW